MYRYNNNNNKRNNPEIPSFVQVFTNMAHSDSSMVQVIFMWFITPFFNSSLFIISDFIFVSFRL